MVFIISCVAFIFVVAIAKRIIQVDEASFSCVLDDSKYSLVTFYAPWCTQSKLLLPELDKAEIECKKTPPCPATFAKVDCTLSKPLCKRYKIKGYPTMIIFKNGKFLAEHDEDRNAEDILKFLKTLK